MDQLVKQIFWEIMIAPWKKSLNTQLIFKSLKIYVRTYIIAMSVVLITGKEGPDGAP